jgi:hypothetical protein
VILQPIVLVLAQHRTRLLPRKRVRSSVHLRIGELFPSGNLEHGVRFHLCCKYALRNEGGRRLIHYARMPAVGRVFVREMFVRTVIVNVQVSK